MQRNSQVQKQNQRLKILPQQIQFLNLLQLNAAEMENYINRELQENPFLEFTPQNEDEPNSELENRTEEDSEIDYDNPENWGFEEDIPSYNLKTENGFKDETPRELLAVSTETWQHNLKHQIRLEGDVKGQKLQLVEFVVDSLREDGMMPMSLTELTDNYSFSINQLIPQEEMEEALAFVQELEPPGIGARDLRECLLLQIEHLIVSEHKIATIELAREILDKHINKLASKNYEKLKADLKVDTAQIRAAIDLITSLNPHPVSVQPQETISDNSRIIPDYLVEIQGNEIVASLLNSRSGTIKLGAEAVELSKQNLDKKATNFLKMKMEDARWLEEALQQRDTTMLNTIRIILTLQRDFFLTGDKNKLKPMVLKDIADPLEMDVSTISRVTSRKYAQTPYGIINLKDLFGTTFTTNDGKEMTTNEIQNVLAEIIEGEDKTTPYNDSQLQSLLSEKGFNIARRTVAKYRENLNIPVANQRRELV